MFLHVSMILFTVGEWYPSMPCRWYPSMPCRFPGDGIPVCLAGFQGGAWGVWLEGSPGPHPGEVEGSGLGGGSPSRHLGGLQAHTRWGLQAYTWAGGVSRPTPSGCIPACIEADIPCRQLLMRAVRILLECILVFTWIQSETVCG